MFQNNPRLWLVAILTLVVCACEQTLPGQAPGASPEGSFNLPSSTPEATLDAFKSTLHPLMTTSCGRCHGVGQPPLHSVNDAQTAMLTIVENSLVNFYDPANSQIVVKIRGGHNGFPVSLANQLQTQIIAWIANANVPSPLPGPLPGPGPSPNPAPTPTPLAPTYTSLVNNILVPKCIACHSAAARVQLISYATVMQQVKPGNASRSKLIQVTSSGAMPPGADDLTADELAALRTWIQNGALNN